MLFWRATACYLRAKMKSEISCHFICFSLMRAIRAIRAKIFQDIF